MLNDANNQLHPALAVSWRAIDPTTWEIKLRDKVKFHDGSDFTAETSCSRSSAHATCRTVPRRSRGSVASIVNMRALDRLYRAVEDVAAGTFAHRAGRPRVHLV